MHYKTAAINHPDRVSAEAIAAALAQNRDALAHYADALKRDFTTYLKQRLAQYTQEQRWPASRFWQRRHSGPAELTELPRPAALAHVECATPL